MLKAPPNIVWCSWTNITELNFNPQLEQVINNDHLVRPFLVFRSAESHFSSNILGFLNISGFTVHCNVMPTGHKPITPASQLAEETRPRMLFQRDTRSKTKTIKVPAHLEHYSVVQLTQKTAKKKKKLSSDLRSSWKLREAVGSADEDSDGISDERATSRV
ncbi:hypothetical protein DAPPUDRAFT_272834 [Daphnia pulex]|uniref:Uncharacterized protein n=1 Tax=Daphnia pulex TaxID=6669 RepID=E9I387_DAPPU|nr:hypothetical protein DAPPUDRAFT_272834 [Daphnia pulex]|eukprot:EFX61543.1 hypothetical protein DAPPUDRAFT_272834 [Daphnia pulex]